MEENLKIFEEQIQIIRQRLVWASKEISLALEELIATSGTLSRQSQERIEELKKINEELIGESEQRRQKEAALEESENKYRQLAENVSDVIFRYNFRPIRRVEYLNAAVTTISGYTREEFYDDPDLPLKVVHPEDRSRLKDLMKSPPVMDEHYILRWVCKHGQIIFGEICPVPIFDHEGNIEAVEGVIRDVTHHMQVEKTLQELWMQLGHLSSQLLVAEENKKKIAQQLQDKLGQSLNSIKSGAESILKELSTGTTTEGIISTLGVISMAQGCIEEISRISANLHASLLDDLWILPSIDLFCREFQMIYSGITVEKDMSVEEKEIPKFLKITIFQIIKEAMNNAAKHSGTDLINIYLAKTGTTMELTIRDTGSGFNQESCKKGLGLATMEEQVRLTGGSFAIESVEGQGTLIRAAWPSDE